MSVILLHWNFVAAMIMSLENTFMPFDRSSSNSQSYFCIVRAKHDSFSLALSVVPLFPSSSPYLLARQTMGKEGLLVISILPKENKWFLQNTWNKLQCACPQKKIMSKTFTFYECASFMSSPGYSMLFLLFEKTTYTSEMQVVNDFFVIQSAKCLLIASKKL